MQKIIATITLVLVSWCAFPQVGINTTSPAAQLEVKSSNQAAPSNTDGLIIPKVDAFPAANPTAAQQGMMVYLTTTSGTNQPGFYYWDNTTTAWVGIGSDKKAWSLTGDAATNPATDFIGTTDAQPLAVKTNNTERMRVLANGNVGIGTATPQTKFHAFGGASGMTPNPFSVATIEGNASAYLSVLSAGETGFIFGSNGNSTNGAIVYNNPAMPEALLFRTNGNITRMTVGSSGNVGIGSGLPNSRMEITASNAAAPSNTDGLIIPRVNAFPASNPTAAQNGMMVFLNNTAGAYKSGFYYWDNPATSWKGVGSSGTPNDWGLTGNTGTNAATHFIGTGDDNDLVFKRNNVRAGIIGTTNTSFGKGSLNPVTTGANNTAVGMNVLQLDSSGFRNTAMGANAMANQTTGSYNTAVGTAALYNSTTGGSNTAVGDASMSGMIGGTFNVGVGNNTLSANTEGDGNTALGHRAMFANILGNNSTAVGMNALYNNQSSGIVGVGHEALAQNTTGQFNTATGSYSLHNNLTGGFNTANGYNAMYGNTGGYNTAVGVNALFSNNTASGITAIGAAALYYNTAGLNNTAVGYTALNYNSTGNWNTATGYGALYASNGNNNSAFGNSALLNNQTGDNNTATGSAALVFNTGGSRNTASGVSSLNANQTGNQNTAMGYQTLYGNTTGSSNVAVGNQALYTNQTASSLVAVGNVALYSNTTGFNNNAVGGGALYSNSTGSNNTSMGAGSLYHSNGDYNTAFGSNALVNNTAGYDNTSNGAFSMAANTLGFRNTAQGGAALQSNTLGNYNVASGYFALGGNQIGVANTAIGSYAGVANVGGNDNTVLGYQGLHDNIDGSNNLAAGANAIFHNSTGSNNTALGHSAMSNTTTGDNNVALGAGAMINQTSGDSNIAIGTNSALPSLTGSNQLSIGNVIFGSGMNSASAGKIAVGKTVPDAKMEIAASNAAAPANTDGLLIPRVFNFPVVNPTAAQNGMMIYLSTIVGSYAAGFYYWDNASTSWLPVGGKTGWSIYGTANTNPSTHFMGTSDNNDVSMRANGAEVMRLEVGGNVGIGTNNPTTKLEVNGFTKLGGATAPAIKTLKLTGTTQSSQGTTTFITHGLTSSKILSVSILIEYAAGASVPPSYNGSAGYEYDYYINGTSIAIWTKSGNSGSILSKPIRVLVTYEE